MAGERDRHPITFTWKLTPSCPNQMDLLSDEGNGTLTKQFLHSLRMDY